MLKVSVLSRRKKKEESYFPGDKSCLSPIVTTTICHFFSFGTHNFYLDGRRKSQKLKEKKHWRHEKRRERKREREKQTKREKEREVNAEQEREKKEEKRKRAKEKERNFFGRKSSEKLHRSLVL